MQLVINSKINSIIGVYSYERIYSQEIQYQITIKLLKNHQYSLNKIEQSIKNIVINYLQKNQPKLIEKICYDIALTILKKYSHIQTLNINIKKPCAIAHADYCYVSLSTY